MALSTTRRPSNLPWAAIHSHILKAGDRALAACHAGTALRSGLRVEGRHLLTPGRDFPLSDFDRIVVLGAGKAVAPMARALSGVLGDRITEGVTIVPDGCDAPDIPHIRVIPGDHPVPLERGFRSSLTLLAAARRASAPRTLAIVLLTGGASALLSVPMPPMVNTEKSLLIERLVRCGAPIGGINTVRRHLSLIKGGRLAACMAPATVVTFALSDVPGNLPHDVGSGPTVPDPTTVKDAEDILWDHLHPNDFAEARTVLARPEAETVKPEDQPDWLENFHVVADNEEAREDAARSLKERGYKVLTLDEDLSGTVPEIAERLLRTWKAHLREAGSGAALVAGGEPHHKVPDDAGKGGRCHELAVLLARGIAGDPMPQSVLAFGTDGMDGSSGAAGALIDTTTLSRAAEANLDVDDVLARHDTAPFFSTLGDQVVSGNTFTNVMDLFIFASSSK